MRLASFQTDASGTGSPRFRLPDWNDGSYKLRVAARIGRDEEVITHQSHAAAIVASDGQHRQAGLSARRCDPHPQPGRCGDPT